MNEASIYKTHWKDGKFTELFWSFKQFINKAEKDFAVQCGKVLGEALRKGRNQELYSSLPDHRKKESTWGKNPGTQVQHELVRLAKVQDSYGSTELPGGVQLGLARTFARHTKQSSAVDFRNEVEENQVQVVEIGIGDGAFTLDFVKEFAKTNLVSEYTGIDVSSHLLRLAQRKFKEMEKWCGSVKLMHEDAEAFTPKNPPDLIVSFNSWYGIRFSKVHDYYTSLKSGGVLGILLNSEMNITCDLTRKYIEPIISSGFLIKWLKDNGVSYKLFPLYSKALSKLDFLSTKEISPQAEAFFRYVLRDNSVDLGKLHKYLIEKPDKYFRLPQDFILIMR